MPSLLSVPQFAACGRCANYDCLAIVIIPAVPPERKGFDAGNQLLKLACPACDRPFSISFVNIEYREVTDEQLTKGFIRLIQ